MSGRRSPGRRGERGAVGVELHRYSDRLLVAAASRGDAASFAELVRRHGGLVYRVAFRMLGDAEDAADCVQETWLQVWRHLPDFRGTSAFPTWLYRVTTSQALMMLRRRRPTAPLAESERPAGSQDDQDERVLARAGVRWALAQLSAEHRTVVVLHEFEGLPMRQVAHVVGIGLPAAKQRLRRARIALARLLGGWQEREGERGADE